MKLIYLNSALKCNSFDVAIDIKIQFFRVLVTIEPGRSLLQIRYHELRHWRFTENYVCLEQSWKELVKLNLIFDM